MASINKLIPVILYLAGLIILSIGAEMLKIGVGYISFGIGIMISILFIDWDD